MDFYNKFDEIFAGIIKVYKPYSNSETLRRFFIERFTSLIYAQIIKNYFNNLNAQNVLDEKLPKGKIGYINLRYKRLISKTNKVISNPLSRTVLTEKDYLQFKSSLEESFSEFLKILLEIERLIKYENLIEYLNNKTIEMEKVAKTHKIKGNDANYFIGIGISYYVKKRKEYPKQKEINRIIKALVTDSMPEASKIYYANIRKQLKNFIKQDRQDLSSFKKGHLQKWGHLLDLMNYFIELSEEFGEITKNKLPKPRKKINYKHDALIKIHARAVQISREILCLAEGGFADGGLSRWRSLHELSVIALFLHNEKDELSERYLDHEIIKSRRNADDYKRHYKKLGYAPLNLKNYNYLKKEELKLTQKYAPDYNYSGGYGWIPQGILKNRTFESLQEYVGRDNWKPFYNMASDATHAGSKGFFRIGLWDEVQDKLLLTGRTDHGLEDPIQNTIISLGLINSCLLTLKTDYESLIALNTMHLFTEEIKDTVLKLILETDSETNN